MAQVRKTRQQKIQLAERRSTKKVQNSTDHISVNHSAAVEQAKQEISNSFEMQTQATYTHVAKEVKRIAWMSAICLLLLALATVWLSPMPVFQSMRQTLGL